MNRLLIHERNFLPYIHLDKEKNIFQIKGKSLPEDSQEFYIPVFEWFEEYFKNPNPETIVEFDLEYYNSTSARDVANIIKLLDKNYLKGYNISIIWYYNKKDEMMKENGEDFSLLFSIPIKIIAKTN